MVTGNLSITIPANDYNPAQGQSLPPQVDIDHQAEKILKHIDRLKAQIGNRRTHGGKRYRARKYSIQLQVNEAEKRLNELLRRPAAPFFRINLPPTMSASTGEIPTPSSSIPEQYHSAPSPLTPPSRYYPVSPDDVRS